MSMAPVTSLPQVLPPVFGQRDISDVAESICVAGGYHHPPTVVLNQALTCTPQVSGVLSW